MQVKELLSTDPVETINEHASVADAARRMLDDDVGILTVLDGDRLVGVITDRDIVLRCVAFNQRATNVSVRDVMTVEVLFGYDDQSVDSAKQIMIENGIQRLPIMNHHRHLVGILSLPALEGHSESHKKPTKVTVYKEKTDSSGHPHKVALRTVYVTGKQTQEEAKTTASKIVEKEQHVPLAQVASGVDAESLPDKGHKRSH